MNAHFNSNLGWGHFSFSREELLTLKLIDRTKEHLVEQCLIKGWHSVAEYGNSLPKVWPEVKTFMKNSHYLSEINWSVFINHSKIFIPQQIWKLSWLVCTLKYTQVTNQNDEVHNPFSVWEGGGGAFCEPTFKHMWRKIL